jgi:hypothetical protein
MFCVHRPTPALSGASFASVRWSALLGSILHLAALSYRRLLKVHQLVKDQNALSPEHTNSGNDRFTGCWWTPELLNKLGPA